MNFFPPVLFLDASAVGERLPYSELIETLRLTLGSAIQSPLRTSYSVGTEDESLLCMPAWSVGEYIGVKLVTVFPSNSGGGRPGVQGAFVLFDGGTGAPVAILDGTELTHRRTAAIAALATDLLANPAAQHLAILGTGGLSPHLVKAHVALRGWQRVTVWGRNPAKAFALFEALASAGIEVEVASTVADAVRDADVVTCATSSKHPILESNWVKDGAHINLMGSYAAHLQEADVELVAQSRVWLDNREAVLREGGDIIIPIQRGLFSEDQIEGELADCLVKSVVRDSRSKTLFKSVGWAALDLIAARSAVSNTSRELFSKNHLRGTCNKFVEAAG